MDRKNVTDKWPGILTFHPRASMLLLIYQKSLFSCQRSSLNNWLTSLFFIKVTDLPWAEVFCSPPLPQDRGMPAWAITLQNVISLPALGMKGHLVTHETKRSRF